MTAKNALHDLLKGIESALSKQGYPVQSLLSYLADVNEKELHRLQEARELELLMIFGGDDLIGLRKIFARFFDELHPKGLGAILITGGIGRLTTTLLQAVLEEQESSSPSSLSIQKQSGKTLIRFERTEEFLGQERIKRVKTPPFDLEASKESLLPYVAEADIYLELFLNEWLQRGYAQEGIEIIGYDDYLRDMDGLFILDRRKTEAAYKIRPERAEQIVEACRQGKLVLLVENVSTNTGSNTSYALEMLCSLNYVNSREEAQRLASRTAVYQQPALQLRTKYTVGKLFGSLPLSVSYAPDYSSLLLPERAKLLLLMSGEFRRLFSYSQSPYHFFRRPEHFDSQVAEFFQEHSGLLTELEHSYDSALLSSQA